MNIANTSEDNSQNKGEEKIQCGIIMPISEIGGCSPEHWSDVLGILRGVAGEVGFVPNLVSDSDEVGVIQKRIVQNLYTNPVVICDVSCKNANVMFELGMRLAFDKPTIIIKDNITDFSFDTGVIEHLEYPRDLRYQKIINFKRDLAKKLKATYSAYTEGNTSSSFLKSFGDFKVAKIKTEEITGQEYMLGLMSDMRMEMKHIRIHLDKNATPTIFDRNMYKQSDSQTRSKMIENIFEDVSEKYGISEGMFKSNIETVYSMAIASNPYTEKYFPDKSTFYNALQNYLKTKDAS